MHRLAKACLVAFLCTGWSDIAARAEEPLNPLTGPDCTTAMRNGFKGVFNKDGSLNMSFQCQDYSDGSWWTLGQYLRSRGR